MTCSFLELLAVVTVLLDMYVWRNCFVETHEIQCKNSKYILKTTELVFCIDLRAQNCANCCKDRSESYKAHFAFLQFYR